MLQRFLRTRGGEDPTVGTSPLKARKVLLKTITNATLSTFETDVNSWLAGLEQNEFVSATFRYENSLYTAYILYVED